MSGLGLVPAKTIGKSEMDEERKRFIVEIGTGIDIHGEDATKAACRAVKDAVSRSCLSVDYWK